jgi:halimadienyl-diphosphate synthase
MDLTAAAAQLVLELDQRMSPSLYDAAWLLRLRADTGAPVHPDYLGWLLSRQHPNGSWGSAIRYYHHDRIICTLVAAIAIAEVEQSAETRDAVRLAEKYLWQNLHLVFRDTAFAELVGFELLFPTLMEEARRAGLHIPAHNYGVSNIRAEKLRLIPPELLYSRTVTTVHSLEFLGSDVDPDDLHRAVFENGSFGNSPATTAYYLHTCSQFGTGFAPEAQAYLDRVSSAYNPSIYLYPFRNFESLWVINNLALVDRSDKILDWVPGAYLDELERSILAGGIGLDDEFGIPDADCTSVAYFLLALAGRSPDPAALAGYEVPEDRIFRTYFFERNPSVSTNIHALDAIRLMPYYPDRELVMDRIKRMLLSERRFNLFWTDKWHASPFYATSHALVSLLDSKPPIHPDFLDTVDWMIHNQRDDGSWGFFNRGTAEETAYALLALQQAYRFGLVPSDVLKKGVDFLLEHGGLTDLQPRYVELWLGKCLYAPYDIIRSAILAAMLRHEQMFS